MKKLLFPLIALIAFASCKNEDKESESSPTPDNPGIYYIAGTVNDKDYEFREGVSSREVVDNVDMEDLGGGAYEAEYTCGIYKFTSPYPYMQLWVTQETNTTNDAANLATMFEIGTDTIGEENSNGVTWNFLYQKNANDFYLVNSTYPKINITEVTDLGNITVNSAFSGIDNTTRRVIQVSGNIEPCTITDFSNPLPLDTAHFTIRFVSNQTF